jgi:hypothetical protein
MEERFTHCFAFFSSQAHVALPRSPLHQSIPCLLLTTAYRVLYCTVQCTAGYCKIRLRTAGSFADMTQAITHQSDLPMIMHSSGSHTQNPKCQHGVVTRPQMQPMKTILLSGVSSFYCNFLLSLCDCKECIFINILFDIWLSILNKRR